MVIKIYYMGDSGMHHRTLVNCVCWKITVPYPTMLSAKLGSNNCFMGQASNQWPFAFKIDSLTL